MSDAVPRTGVFTVGEWPMLPPVAAEFLAVTRPTPTDGKT
jgi:hypothetical protein